MIYCNRVATKRIHFGYETSTGENKVFNLPWPSKLEQINITFSWSWIIFSSWLESPKTIIHRTKQSETSRGHFSFKWKMLCNITASVSQVTRSRCINLRFVRSRFEVASMSAVFPRIHFHKDLVLFYVILSVFGSLPAKVFSRKSERVRGFQGNKSQVEDFFPFKPTRFELIQVLKLLRKSRSFFVIWQSEKLETWNDWIS